jgi:hypothetical protein
VFKLDGSAGTSGQALVSAGSATPTWSTLGTMASQNATAVAITGGTITGITDLTVADGGTGVSTLSANAVLLGNGTSALQTVAPSTSGNVLTSDGTTWTSAAAPSGGVTSLNGQTGAITNTGFGNIGSYVIGASSDQFSAAEFLPNVTVAGNTLIRSTGTATVGISSESTAIVVSARQASLGLSGTWRSMTRGYGGGTVAPSQLWVRIS